MSFATSKDPPPTTAGRLQAIGWEGRMQVFPKVRLDGQLRVPYGEIRFNDGLPDALSIVGLDMEARGEPGASRGLGIERALIEELNLNEIAAVLGVSVPRVHQLKADALKKARIAMVGQTE